MPQSTGKDHFLTAPLLVLSENRFAYTAIDQLCRQDRRREHPLLYVYGVSGVGKSHLVGQFYRRLQQWHPKPRTAYVTAAQFAAELADASDGAGIPQFQERYRSLDALICEDLQALERRREPQQQLVFVIADVLRNGGRVVMTSRVPPAELDDMSLKLVNRCHGGICVALALPALKSRLALLNQFARMQQTTICREQLRDLAENLPISPRELSAAVTQLDTMARLEGAVMVTRPIVDRYLSGEFWLAKPSIATIATAVARHFAVSIRQLRSPLRLQSLMLPRHSAMYLAHEISGASLSAIGRFFGRPNHSTVIHACRRIQQRIQAEPKLRQHLEQIRTQIRRTDATQ